MPLQMMQQFQEKHEVTRSDDIVDTDQLNSVSVEMYQSNVRDLQYYMYRWIPSLSGAIHRQEVELFKQNNEIQESQSSFGRGQKLKKPSSKGKEYVLLKSSWHSSITS